MSLIQKVVIDLWDFFILNLYLLFTYLENLFRFFVPKPLKSLKGEIILVTGSGRGIGREICLQLADFDAKIICCSRSQGPNDEVVKEIKRRGGKAFGFTVDVSKREQVQEFAAKVRKEIGQVSIVINNAGILEVKSFLETKPSEFENIYGVNLFSNIWILKEFLPGMIARKRGHICSVNSASGVLSTGYITAYSSSKFAAHGFMESLRDELRLHPKKPDIKLTNVYPFFTHTEMIGDVNTNTRFPFLIPKTEPEEVAAKIIEGIRRNEEFIFIPKTIKYLAILDWLVPIKAKHFASDFLQCYIRPQNVIDK